MLQSRRIWRSCTAAASKARTLGNYLPWTTSTEASWAEHRSSRRTFSTFSTERAANADSDMWYTVVLIVHVAIALMLIGLVLLQRGKGAEAGTGFGAGASGTVFGARGSANFLSRSTAVLATLFFLSCLSLV